MRIYPCILSIAAFICCLTFFSCNKNNSSEADKSLSEAVANLSLPQSLNDGSTLTQCTYTDKVLTFVCNVKDDDFKNINLEKKKTNTTERLKTELFPHNLINKVVEADASIRYVLVNGNDSIAYEISSSELKTGI